MTEEEMVLMIGRTHSNAFKNTNFYQRRLTNACRVVNGLEMDFSEILKEET